MTPPDEIYGQFLAFVSHEIAASYSCRGCGAKLHAEDAVDKGYPPRRGQFGIKCRKCGYIFFGNYIHDYLRLLFNNLHPTLIFRLQSVRE